ncbi:MAG: hypothetical protein H8D23_08840 [Candidatus Brocadiales bacterium]|nr:hypothetical protein [Candidatus Brocadiales bacterium]
MNQLLKRLEIIKHAISVEDEDIIDLQIRKIKVLQNDLDTCMILELIDKNDYETVIDRIDQYLSKHKGLITYVNPKPIYGYQ